MYRPVISVLPARECQPISITVGEGPTQIDDIIDQLLADMSPEWDQWLDLVDSDTRPRYVEAVLGAVDQFVKDGNSRLALLMLAQGSSAALKTWEERKVINAEIIGAIQSEPTWQEQINASPSGMAIFASMNFIVNHR